MGHIMVRTMKRAQQALKALTLLDHGVNGADIYLYGEAWDFGEVACNQRGSNAAQLNIAGTGLGAPPSPGIPLATDGLIAAYWTECRPPELRLKHTPCRSPVAALQHTGVDSGPSSSIEPLTVVRASAAGAFNDRFRDAALGGSPFGNPTQQGFLTGLSTDPRTPPTAAAATDMQEALAAYTSWLKLGMAGNLRDFPLELPDGSVQAGKEFRYGHAPAAYGKLSEENVLYLGCHDNEALYDQVVLKANHKGDASMCARVVQMSLGLIAVSQGIAFFHAGDELLRSKSLDRDSYNSGDWCVP